MRKILISAEGFPISLDTQTGHAYHVQTAMTRYGGLYQTRNGSILREIKEGGHFGTGSMVIVDSVSHPLVGEEICLFNWESGNPLDFRGGLFGPGLDIVRKLKEGE